MKNVKIALTLMMALILTLAAGTVALAENAAETPEKSAGEVLPGQESTAGSSEDSDALQEALEAYRNARSASRREALEEELKSFVEAGKLTQEQADLILAYCEENQSLRGSRSSFEGCFRNDSGRGGRMDGGFNERGGHGVNNRQPSPNGNNAQAGGTAFQPGTLSAEPETKGI